MRTQFKKTQLPALRRGVQLLRSAIKRRTDYTVTLVVLQNAVARALGYKDFQHLNNEVKTKDNLNAIADYQSVNTEKWLLCRKMITYEVGKCLSAIAQLNPSNLKLESLSENFGMIEIDAINWCPPLQEDSMKHLDAEWNLFTQEFKDLEIELIDRSVKQRSIRFFFSADDHRMIREFQGLDYINVMHDQALLKGSLILKLDEQRVLSEYKNEPFGTPSLKDADGKRKKNANGNTIYPSRVYCTLCFNDAMYNRNLSSQIGFVFTPLVTRDFNFHAFERDSDAMYWSEESTVNKNQSNADLHNHYIQTISKYGYSHAMCQMTMHSDKFK